MNDDPDESVPPPLPTPGDWARLGLTIGQELHGGHQSRVLRAEGHGAQLAVKLTDRRFVDAAHLPRLELLETLASTDVTAVGPLRLGGSLAVEVGGWLVAAYRFVQGRVPVVTERGDVATMAATLAALHRSLREIDAPEVPPVAALRSLAPGVHRDGDSQLLHGDFASSNVLLTDRGVRVVDFDDAGHGPVEFEIGSTLYMVLFDTRHRSRGTYERFRDRFVRAYETSAGTALDRVQVTASIVRRRRALAGWLDDLATAPIGIRTSSADWQRELRRFAEST